MLPLGNRIDVGQPPPAVPDRRGRLSHIAFAIFWMTRMNQGIRLAES